MQPTTANEYPLGVRNPARPTEWLVPPWSADTTACGIVRHFQRFAPLHDASDATWLAYYQGYRTALACASTEDLTDQAGRDWYQSVRMSAERCLTRLVD